MENEKQTSEISEPIEPAMYQSLDGDDVTAVETESPDEELFHPRSGGRNFFEPLDWDLD